MQHFEVYVNPSVSIVDRNGGFGETEYFDKPVIYDPISESSFDISGKWSKRVELGPGLALIVTDVTFPRHFVVRFDIERAPLLFCFILSGKARSTINHGRGGKTSIDGNNGTSHISFFPKSRGVSEFSAGTPARIVHIQLDPILLSTLLHGEFDDIPPDFYAAVEGSLKSRYHCSGIMTPNLQIALYQMLNCSYHGLTRFLFLEGKALELVAFQLEQFLFSRKREKSPQVLRQSDIERIHEARDIVIRNMKQPLSLMELARQVGLNEFKLKRGFRRVFGKTVFGYLHELRMERSRLLLEEGQMNVKEISYAVGYMDSGRFSDAFKRQFGVRPSLYYKNKSFSYSGGRGSLLP